IGYRNVTGVQTCALPIFGKEVVKTLEIIPAQYIVREDIYYTYACKSCSENADEGCETPVVKAPREKNIIPGSFATPEAIAHIMTDRKSAVEGMAVNHGAP